MESPVIRGWEALERRFKKQAISDDCIYLPNSEPEVPVDHLFIAMEPSLGRWARGRTDVDRIKNAHQKIGQGFRNFLYSFEDFLLHFAIRRFLCASGNSYHLTDVSKGAMTVSEAAIEREGRYQRWLQLLRDEIELVSHSASKVWTIGRAPFDFLQKHGLQPDSCILHYSSQASRSRRLAIVGREDEFAEFKRRPWRDKILSTAQAVLVENEVSQELRRSTMERLYRASFTESRQALLFTYKCSLA